MEILRFNILEEKEKATPLPHGGTDREGNVYGADSVSLLRNGKRLLPIMGEFHYSRWEPEGWEEELLKMKSGGIEILATYLFWIHHEEKEGEWDFSGCRNIRRFVELCGKVGLKVWLRIGPWVHAECRHGGFPDWIQWSDSFEPRTNDRGYLDAVEKYFNRLGAELRGLMCKDGGPVIGVQLENEYGHVGGPSDEKIRYAHMKKLLELAKAAGFEVPWYTATGWGMSPGMIEDTLPVLGGYVDAPWDTTTKPMPVSKKFLFLPYRNDATIGTNREAEENLQTGEEMTKYPFLSAELGGGLQVTSHRRPVCFAKDTEAFMLCMLGGGVNLPGYYMYHGGINPDGKYTTLNETQEIGGYTTLPVKSYDFQACINEAGRLNASYGALKKFHLMIQDVAGDLAGAALYYPEKVPEDGEDLTTLRAVLRLNQENGKGWLFINNHQRLRRMVAHEDVRAEIWIGDHCIKLPEISVRADGCYVLPFVLGEKGELKEASNAGFLTRIGERRFYYTEDPGEAVFYPERPAGPVTVLSLSEAERAFRMSDGLYVVEYPGSCVIEQDGEKWLLTEHPDEKPVIYREDGRTEEIFPEEKPVSVEAHFSQIAEEKDEQGAVCYRDYEVYVDMPETFEAHNLYLNVSYVGDRAEVYQEGRLIDDWYTTGGDWNISLKRFGYPEKLMIRIYDSAHTIPCSYGQDVYYDLPVEAGCEMRSVHTFAEYKIRI